jgi:hypothetical protein
LTNWIEFWWAGKKRRRFLTIPTTENMKNTQQQHCQGGIDKIIANCRNLVRLRQAFQTS